MNKPQTIVLFVLFTLSINKNYNVMFNGRVDGKISSQSRGEFGFGYESRNGINSQNLTSALKANNTELLFRYRIIINKVRKSSWDN